ncbi:hypothetical protein SNEBB_011093 [Seison nebaliae]|nr:hypothetical protein SNEBB_011093 [Seison nebaliae]
MQQGSYDTVFDRDGSFIRRQNYADSREAYSKNTLENNIIWARCFEYTHIKSTIIHIFLIKLLLVTFLFMKQSLFLIYKEVQFPVLMPVLIGFIIFILLLMAIITYISSMHQIGHLLTMKVQLFFNKLTMVLSIVIFVMLLSVMVYFKGFKEV